MPLSLTAHNSFPLVLTVVTLSCQPLLNLSNSSCSSICSYSSDALFHTHQRGGLPMLAKAFLFTGRNWTLRWTWHSSPAPGPQFLTSVMTLSACCLQSHWPPFCFFLPNSPNTAHPTLWPLPSALLRLTPSCSPVGFCPFAPFPEQKLHKTKSFSVFFANDSVLLPVSGQCWAHNVDKFVPSPKRQQIIVFTIHRQFCE